MKFAVLGTDGFALRCAQAILDSGCEISVFISMPQTALPLNSVDFSSFTKENDIPYCEHEDINSPAAKEDIRDARADFIFCSWPRILDKELLDIPLGYSIGTHPTALPANRGRHPLHWLISLGIAETALSFFKMDSGVDTGDILCQVRIPIAAEGTISELNGQVDEAGYRGMKELCALLQGDTSFVGEAQDHAKANYWRKRTPHDVMVDLRMSADSIARIVRSYNEPYPYANLIYKSHVVKIADVAIVEQSTFGEAVDNIEPGKVLFARDYRLRVKVADAVVEFKTMAVLPKSLVKAKYIHPPSSYFMDYQDQLNAQLTG
jgi:methionyl-tRNA formyltransferase